MSLIVKCKTSEEEKHGYDVNCLISYHENVFSGGDDGKIIKWDDNLKKLAETQAHPCSVYSLAILNEKLYSCSNDGTVKSWSLDLQPKSVLLQEDGEFWKLAVSGDKLFIGDDQGSIRIVVNDKQVARYELLEGIKDMKVSENFIYTGKDVDVTVTEIGTGPKLTFATRKVTQGRAPITLAGDKLVFTDFTAMGLTILSNDPANNFKSIANVQGAHSMIINALAARKHESIEEVIFYSGSWDKTVKQWKIIGNSCNLDKTIDIGMVINTLEVNTNGSVFAGLENGFIIKLEMN